MLLEPEQPLILPSAQVGAAANPVSSYGYVLHACYGYARSDSAKVGQSTDFCDGIFKFHRSPHVVGGAPRLELIL